jgi:Uma2 family endonuclease
MIEIITKDQDTKQALHFDSEEAFEAWCDEDTHAEYLDGEVIMHSPASFDHENFLPRFISIMEIYVEEKDLGAVCSSNFQLRLRSGRRRMADLCFISKDRLHLVHENYMDGAPDLVVEVVSPESVTRDWYDKYSEYEASGVREYLVIDRASQRVAFYRRGRDGGFAPVPEQDGKLYSHCLPGFWIKPEWFWQKPMPNVLQILRELGLVK